MSERTVKLPGWGPQCRPAEDSEVQAYRQLIVEVVFGAYHAKRELLAKMQMPPQPVSLAEIYLALKNRVLQLRRVRMWPYRKHGKRWVDRRVNEAATPKYYADGMPKIVATTAGMYEPNPQLFKPKPVVKEAPPSV